MTKVTRMRHLIIQYLHDDIKKLWDKQPWYTTMSSLSMDWLKHELYVRINALEKMKMEA